MKPVKIITDSCSDLTGELLEKYYTDEIRVIEALNKKIAHTIQMALGINAKIKIVEPKSLVRSEGKAVHVIDKRKLY